MPAKIQHFVNSFFSSSVNLRTLMSFAGKSHFSSLWRRLFHALWDIWSTAAENLLPDRLTRGTKALDLCWRKNEKKRNWHYGFSRRINLYISVLQAIASPALTTPSSKKTALKRQVRTNNASKRKEFWDFDMRCSNGFPKPIPSLPKTIMNPQTHN